MSTILTQANLDLADKEYERLGKELAGIRSHLHAEHKYPMFKDKMSELRVKRNRILAQRVALRGIRKNLRRVLPEDKPKDEEE